MQEFFINKHILSIQKIYFNKIFIEWHFPKFIQSRVWRAMRIKNFVMVKICKHIYFEIMIYLSSMNLGAWPKPVCTLPWITRP